MNEITIIYEDADIVVVNKPAGLVVHPDGRTTEKTVTDWVLEKYPDMKGVGEPLTLSSGTVIDRPGIVHRIDRDTSGALVIAKNQAAFQSLKSQFQNREVDKVYHAFVYGNMSPTAGGKEGVINRPIGKSRKDFRLWSAQRLAKGEMREAITEFAVQLATDEVSFVEAKPKTGRTHQIRVHFKAVNHPVVCDRLYAPKREPLLGFNRLALHAYSVTFANKEGAAITATAPYPADFTHALSEIRKTA